MRFTLLLEDVTAEQMAAIGAILNEKPDMDAIARRIWDENKDNPYNPLVHAIKAWREWHQFEGLPVPGLRESKRVFDKFRDGLDNGV